MSRSPAWRKEAHEALRPLVLRNEDDVNEASIRARARGRCQSRRSGGGPLAWTDAGDSALRAGNLPGTDGLEIENRGRARATGGETSPEVLWCRSGLSTERKSAAPDMEEGSPAAPSSCEASGRSRGWDGGWLVPDTATRAKIKSANGPETWTHAICAALRAMAQAYTSAGRDLRPTTCDESDERSVMAFAPRRGARSLWRYLRAEKRTLRQGLAALVVGTVAAFVAGITLAAITHTLTQLPGLIILVPAVLSMRGTIFGSMGARLATATHAGLFEVSRGRTGVLYREVFVATVLTMSSSLYLALLAKAAAAAFGLPSIRLFDLITISVVGGVLDSAIILVLTVILSIVSFRRGYDLDAVSTPIVTAVADMVTVPTLFLATFIVHVRVLSTVVAVASIVLAAYAILRGAQTDLPQARRILLEMVLIILLTPLLDILAGTVVEARLDRFVAFPGLLVLVPPFVAGAGSLGGILCSRLSSKLHLGLVTPRGVPDSAAIPDAGLTMSFSLVVFLMTGALGLGFAALATKAYPGINPMIWGTLVAGVIATLEVVVFSYYVAIVTSRFGLDPDNHSVPIITSVMDLAGVLTFLFVFAAFGVSIHG
jgi:mgtE-like transporter